MKKEISYFPGLSAPRINLENSIWLQKRLSDLLHKIRHEIGNMDLLRAHLLTALAVQAGNGAFFLGDCHQGHGGNKGHAAILHGQQMFIIQRNQPGNIQPLRAMADTVMAGGARNGFPCHHLFNNL